jgi:hypothetical protein
MTPARIATRVIASTALLGAVLATAAPAVAQDLIITIERVRALDKIDPVGQADFYAQVTIDGKPTKTQRIRKADDIRPNWVIRAPITKPVTDVKVEILDKDIFTKDDLIDINRLDGKRDLDFSVRTGPCRVIGFAQTYDCSGRGVTIVRSGAEKKAAEITFKVDVSRR